MNALTQIAAAAALHRLAVFGAFHPQPGDDVPDGTATLVMLGPAEPGFWAHLTAQPEWVDGAPDAIDRWSARVIGALAQAFGGRACFPFGGPPYHPFYAWALKTGRAWSSPVALLVHEATGLMVSYRGALALSRRLELPPPPDAAPCVACTTRPCLDVCPVGALGARGYDVPACRTFIGTPAGADCLSRGCAVRRACPVSQSYDRLPEQSAYHMGYFLR